MFILLASGWFTETSQPFLPLLFIFVIIWRNFFIDRSMLHRLFKDRISSSEAGVVRITLLSSAAPARDVVFALI
jgi:hypothetical protein